ARESPYEPHARMNTNIFQGAQMRELPLDVLIGEFSESLGHAEGALGAASGQLKDAAARIGFLRGDLATLRASVVSKRARAESVGDAADGDRDDEEAVLERALATATRIYEARIKRALSVFTQDELDTLYTCIHALASSKLEDTHARDEGGDVGVWPIETEDCCCVYNETFFGTKIRSESPCAKLKRLVDFECPRPGSHDFSKTYRGDFFLVEHLVDARPRHEGVYFTIEEGDASEDDYERVSQLV